MIATMAHKEESVLVNRLSRLMGERRLSIQDVARGAGVSYRALFELYHDRTTRIDLGTLNKLCEFFDVEPGQIFERVPDAAAPEASAE